MKPSNTPSKPSDSPCAACQYRRVKCSADCILAPYFPGSEPQKFLNSHRLFRVSSIRKLLLPLNKENRDAATRNIIFHSETCAKDPAGGCYRLLNDLLSKIRSAAMVHQQHTQILEILRARGGLNCLFSVNNSFPEQQPPPQNNDGASSSSLPPGLEFDFLECLPRKMRRHG